MNFFQLQEQARVKTRWLVFVYAIAVILIVIALDLVFLLVKHLTVSEYSPAGSMTTLLESNSNALIVFSLLIISFIGLASLYRMMSLRGGGSKVAASLGGSRVDASHPDRRVRRLVNIVEEMAIASGLPVPQIYVLEQESGINAFAAGHQPEDAAVAVTRGALEIFNREELQGVLGHEFSHILNGDMRINMRLLGPLFGIMLIGTMGGILLRSSSRVRVRSSRKSSAGVLVVLVLGFGMMIIGSVGQLAGRMIKAAISRQREYLADASAVQFTRNREGIGGALKKIAAWQYSSTLVTTGAEEVSHMLFANGLQRRFSSLLATHPPLEQRLQQMGIKIDNRELEKLAVSINVTQAAARTASEAEQTVSGLHQSPAGYGADENDFMASSTAGESLQSAHSIINHIPDEVRIEAVSPHTVREVILALLLSDNTSTRERQLNTVRTDGSTLDSKRTLMIRKQLDRLHEEMRLPILDLGFPAVRQMTWQQQLELYNLVEKLIPLDELVSSFEYMLSRLLLQMLEESQRPDSSSGRKQLKLVRLQYHLRTLFSVVASFGHDSEALAKRAYNAGMQNLLGSQQWPEYYLPADWVAHIDAALVAIDRARPLIKEEIINSLALTISFDSNYRLEEYEMLRVISALLHCPMPLIQQDAAWN